MFTEHALKQVPDEDREGLRDQLIARLKERPNFYAMGIGGHYDGCRYDADTARLAIDLCKKLGLNEYQSPRRFWEQELESSLNTGD